MALTKSQTEYLRVFVCFHESDPIRSIWKRVERIKPSASTSMSLLKRPYCQSSLAQPVSSSQRPEKYISGLLLA